MTSKERLRDSLDGKRPDRPPVFYMGTPNVNMRVGAALSGKGEAFPTMAEFTENDIARLVGADVLFFRPRFVSRPGAVGGFPISVVHSRIHGERAGNEGPQGTRDALRNATSVEEVAVSACWPNPDDYDYTLTDDEIKLSQSHGIVARGNGALFLAAMSLRGMTEFLMDMVENPAMCHAILKKISDYYLDRISRFLAVSGKYIDVVDIGDDVAGQNGMLFSPEMWREYIGPHIERLVSLIHSHGKRALFFGCGGFRDIAVDLIEIGVDGIGRLQSEARGNNFESFKRAFGDRISLWGAMDAQHVLIDCDPVAVRGHIEEIVRTGVTGGRFVAGPTHTFTSDTPTENILAAYSALGCL